MQKFGGGKPTHQSPTPQPVAPQRQANPSQQHRPPAFGPGLAPADPSVDTSSGGGGGGYEKRDDAYWEAHPLSPGKDGATYTFASYVSKIVWWNNGGVTVTCKVSDWDRDANRPREHHGRPIDWRQTASDKQRASDKAYAFWRADLVGAYTAGGWPEESWPKNGEHPAPPWHLFFVHQAADGLMVPIMFGMEVRVTPPRSGNGVFVNVKKVVPVPGPVQAPMPYEVPPGLAELHRWKVAEHRTFGASNTPSAKLDKDQIPMAHLGMRTWKDL